MTLKQMMAAQNGSAYGRRLASDAASQRADFWKKTVLPIAAFATGGAALGAAGGGAAAGGAAAGMGGLPAGMAPGGAMISTAFPTAAGMGGGAFSLGGLMKNPLTGMGIQGMFSLLGQRSQNKAMDKQLASQNASLAKQMELEIADRAEQKRQFDIQQQAAKAALDAQNTMAARQLAAEEADRAYTRSLSEKREAYLDPYRQQSQAARYSLMRMLGIG
ncbi:MAG: hypothetical protein RLY20_3162 [Verrucomicrobiota bacterium]|jgi:hypothetical protein